MQSSQERIILDEELQIDTNANPKILLRGKWRIKEKLYELDFSVICLKKDGHVDDVIYWNNQIHKSKAIIEDHSLGEYDRKSDNGLFNSGETNSDKWDKSRIFIDFNTIQNKTDIYHIIPVISISDGRKTHKYLNDIKNLKILIDNYYSNSPLFEYECKYNMLVTKKTSIYLMDIFRDEQNTWYIKPIGEPVLSRHVQDDMAANAFLYLQNHNSLHAISVKYNPNLAWKSSYDCIHGHTNDYNSLRKLSLLERILR